MNPNTKFISMGHELTCAQWRMLQDIKSGRGFVFDPPSQAVAKSLVVKGLVSVSEGVRTDMQLRLADRRLPIWKVAPVPSLTDFGWEVATAIPRDVDAEKAAAKAALAREAEAARRHRAACEAKSKAYVDDIRDRLAKTIVSSARHYERPALLHALEIIEEANPKWLQILYSQIALAWNESIVGSIPKTKNDLFLEIRARLPFMEGGKKDIESARAAVDDLLSTIPHGTTAMAIVERAKTFLDEFRHFENLRDHA